MYVNSKDHIQIYLENNQIILKETKLATNEGKNTKYPILKINYH